MAASSSKKVFQVAVIVYNSADILDYGSPVEILSHVNYNTDLANPEPAFKVHLIGDSKAIRTGDVPLVVVPDMTFAEAHEMLDDFDILVIPGGSPPLIMKMATSDSSETRFIREFATTEQKGRTEERIVFSVCTGSLFLGATGALSGLRATSHHLALDMLKGLDGTIEVVDSTKDGRAHRYVDGGVNKAGVRVVTAGGVTCGLDGSLYVAELKVGREGPEYTARMSEYNWNRG